VLVVKETGSGLNEQRPKLLKLFSRDDWDVLVVEHKDRLTRFGFGFLEIAAARGRQRIEVVNQTAETDTDDLMQDFVSVVTSFCARLYGRRRSQRRTEQLIAELGSEKGASDVG
jgi:putative resolvase